MPFIIETTQGDTGWQARRAAATHNEAVEAAHDVMIDRSALLDDERWPQGSNADNWEAAYRAVSEGGGKVGPLPDGTVIEIEEVGWPELARRSDMPEQARHVEGNWPREHLNSRRRTVLNAFNEAQGATP